MQVKPFMAAAAMLALLAQAHAQTASATSSAPAAQDKKADSPKPTQAKCRNVPLQRSDKPVTREEVVAELERARREGEVDWHISGNPPAVQRRPCMPSEAGSGG
ncbi:DUF4148 domain-containing protein [Roseateles sp.]|jgi:hypothetical protein|uniref:DUF4148 domain-containing protein n=1 Tax=Roseateles sp. TaxID=1971397 RepID=UPI002DFD88E3|nr:DUF4148 domain-containing protein [Roseateles sp.]